MDKGKTYLLFVRTFDAHLFIDSCGNSSLRSEEGDAIEAIREISKSENYGEIEGRIELGGGVGIAGIKVVARNAQKIFSARTGEDGWFQMRVPPGTYELIAESAEFILVPYELNNDKTERFLVYRGGCAHIEYDASPK